jgi:hypothetical protein
MKRLICLFWGHKLKGAIWTHQDNEPEGGDDWFFAECKRCHEIICFDAEYYLKHIKK